MTIGADAINGPFLTARPPQDALRGQGKHALKLVSLEAERPGVTVRWRSAANASSGRWVLGSICYQNSRSVYDRIKLSLLQRPRIPGELLQIGVFARELGTSTTPVREALIRLAAERLIAYVPKRGFLIKAITEEELRGLYIVNQMHLEEALHYFGEQSGNAAEMHSRDSTQPATELSDRQEDSASIAAKLFFEIAASAGIEEIAMVVCNINDRLHHPRLAECAVIDSRAQELSTMSNLFAIGELDNLLEEIRRYHKLRLQMLPSICKELLSMSFAKR